MKHENFKIIVDGKELENPMIRIVGCFLCGIAIGILLAGGGF